MATTTNLRFDISTGWDGAGLDDARAQLEALKGQIDELSGKQIKIEADKTQAQEELDSLQRQLETLSNQDARVKLGIDDEQAKTAIDGIKARMQTLQDKIVRLNLDDADAKLKMDAFKAEEDRLGDKTVKLKADTSQADKAYQDSADKAQTAAGKATQAWAKASFAMQRASLNLVSAVAMLAPALVPLTAAALGASGAIVSGFGSAGIAAGIFGFSLKNTMKNAMGIYTSVNQLNQTLQAQRSVLAGLKPGSAAYNSELVAIRTTQAQVNAAMAQGTPVQQQVAKSLLDLKSAWASMQQQAEKFTGPLILNGIKGIKDSLGFLPPVIKAVTGVFAPLVAQFDHFATGGGMQKFVNWVIAVGVPNLKHLIDTIMHIGITIVQIGHQFSTSGLSVTKWLDDVTAKLDRWGANGGFARFQQTITNAWPKLKQFFTDFGLAIQHIIEALNGLGPVSFSVIGMVAKVAASLPVPVVQAFFVAFSGYKVFAAVSGAFLGVQASLKTMGAAFREAGVLMTAFKLGMSGTTATIEGNTAANITNKIAVMANAAASRIAAGAQAVWTAATSAWRAVTSGAIVASIGQKVAAIASAVASGVAAAAQWAWNAAVAVFDALSAPVVLIIMAIVAAIAAVGFAIYELVGHWTTVWHTIRQVAEDVWHFLTQGWGQFLLLFLGPLGLIIEVAAHWKEIWDGIKIAAEAVWQALQGAWQAFLDFFKSLWDRVSNDVKNAWNMFFTGVKQIALDVWNALQSAWQDFLNLFKSLWDRVSSDVKNAWDTFFTGAKQIALDVWNALRSAWQDFLNVFKSLWDRVSSDVKNAWDAFFTGLKQRAQTAVNDLRGVWDIIKKVFGSPIEFVVNTVLNNGLLKAVNWLINKLSFGSVSPNLQVPDPHLPTFATGGYIRGAGTGTSDSNLAWLSNGEYVINAAATAFHGTAALDKINAGHPIGAFADGGTNGSAATRGQLSSANAVNLNGDGGGTGGFTDATIASVLGGIIQSVGGAAAAILSQMLGGAANVTSAIASGLSTVANAHIPVVSSIAGFFSGAAKKTSSVEDAIAGAIASWGEKEFSEGTSKLIDYIVQNFLPHIPIPGTLMGSSASGVVRNGASDFLKGAASDIGKFLFSQKQKYAPTFSGGQIPKGEQLTVINAALAADRIDPSQWPMWEAGLNTLITRESGWQVGAINNYDSNAAHGTPSEGLAQVIAPTFAAYRNPTLPNNLLDPVANIAAAINYINATYGGIQNVQQANANMPPKGYDIGGVLGTGYTLAYNATGVPEGVLNPTGLAAIGGFSGLGALNAGTYTYTGGRSGLDGSGRPVVVNVTNNWHGNPDKGAVQAASTDMAEELRQAVQAGVGARST